MADTASLASFDEDEPQDEVAYMRRLQSSASTESLDLSPTNLFSDRRNVDDSPLSSPACAPSEHEDPLVGKLSLEEAPQMEAKPARAPSLGDRLFAQKHICALVAKHLRKRELCTLALLSKAALETARNQLYSSLQITSLVDHLLRTLDLNADLGVRVKSLDLVLGSYAHAREETDGTVQDATDMLRSNRSLISRRSASTSASIEIQGVRAEHMQATMALLPSLRNLTLQAAAAISPPTSFPFPLERLRVFPEESGPAAKYTRPTFLLASLPTSIRALVLHHLEASLGSEVDGDGLPKWPLLPSAGDTHGLRELEMRDVRVIAKEQAHVALKGRRQLDVRRLIGGPHGSHELSSFNPLVSLRLVGVGKLDYRSVWRAIEDASATLQTVQLVDVALDWAPSFLAQRTLGLPTTDLSIAIGRCVRLRELDCTVHKDSPFLCTMVSPHALAGVGRTAKCVDVTLRLETPDSGSVWFQFFNTVGATCLKSLTIHGLGNRDGASNRGRPSEQSYRVQAAERRLGKYGIPVVLLR